MALFIIPKNFLFLEFNIEQQKVELRLSSVSKLNNMADNRGSLMA